MKGKIVLNLNNAMFSLGAARLKLHGVDDDTADELKDITNQIDTIAHRLWDGTELEGLANKISQMSSLAQETGEPVSTASQSLPSEDVWVAPAGTDRGTINLMHTPPSDAAFKKVDKLFFLDEWKGIKSIEPAEIIGKHTLITFNVNTRQLAKYTADRDDNLDLLGLDVKGSTLKNFDSNISSSYSKTVRKPEDMIPFIAGSDHAQATYQLHKINAVPKPLTGRINKHTLLLFAN